MNTLKTCDSIIFEVGNEFLFWYTLISIFVEVSDYLVYLGQVSSLQDFSQFLSVQVACFVLIVVVEGIS